MKLTKLSVAPVLALSLVGLAACAGPVTTTEGSRVKLYSSVDEMSDESTVIIVGRVAAQETTRDIDDLDFTISQIEVDEVVKSDVPLEAGDIVEVRQVGPLPDEESEATVVPPTPLFEADQTYLLYLHPSALPEPLDTQFYVTGANAGAFQSTGALSRRGSASFEAVDHSEGEELPTELTLDEALQAAE